MPIACPGGGDGLIVLRGRLRTPRRFGWGVAEFKQVQGLAPRRRVGITIGSWFRSNAGLRDGVR